MNKAITLLLGLACASGIGLHAQVSNINISNSFAWDGEPFIASNPSNPDNLVLAWMSYQFPFSVGIELKSSFNGGQTWSASTFLPHFSATYNSADVSLAFGHSNEVYVSYVDFRQSPDSGGVYVSRSTDGGLTWSSPVKAIDALVTTEQPIDRPWIAPDNSGTSTDGTLYITTKPPSWIPAPNRPTYTVSTDHGLTWSPLQFADTAGFTSTIIASPMAFPAVAADGTFLMAYPAVINFAPAMVLASSTDQGASLQHGTLGSQFTFSTDTNPKQAWVLLADPTNPNSLYFLWTDNRNGDIDIYCLSSHDKGLTWSAAVRVNDDPVSNGNMQDMVWASVSPIDGTLVAAWRDRRNASGTGFYQSFDVYTASSSDGGNTFSPNVRVTDAITSFDSLLTNSGNDFLSVSISGNYANYAWSDFRSGDLETYFQRLEVSLLNQVKTPFSENETEVFPLPANDQFYIRINNASTEQKKFELIDPTGRKIRSFELNASNFHRLSISVANLPDGIYFLKEVQTEPFVRRIPVVH